VYEWYVNNILVDTGTTYTYNNVIEGSQVYAKLTADTLCANPQTVNSSIVTSHCIVTAVPNIDGLEEFIISPNPNNGSMEVKLKLNQQKRIRFSITDAMGRQVYVSESKLMMGSNTKQIDLGRFSNGLYYLQTTINGKVFVRKIVLKK